MGISIREFQVTMETFGAERLLDREGSRYNILVPCFQIKGIEFFHSGSYYIVHRGNKVPGDIMNRAMAELGETHPGGDNFWWGEVHSIKGMLTLATMLRGDYSKELVDELTNQAYKELLECSLIKSNVKFPFECSKRSPKMQELRKLLEEYSNVVNPFGNCNFKLKEPIEYLDKVKVGLAAGHEESADAYSVLTLTSPSSEAYFRYDSKGWTYRSSVLVQNNHKNGFIHFYHYYENGRNNRNVDEVVYLYYDVQRTGKAPYDDNPEDIDLRISLKTGLTWRTYKEAEARPATCKQIDVMITHLKRSIKCLKKNIIRNIIDTEA